MNNDDNSNSHKKDRHNSGEEFDEDGKTREEFMRSVVVAAGGKREPGMKDDPVGLPLEGELNEDGSTFQEVTTNKAVNALDEDGQTFEKPLTTLFVLEELNDDKGEDEDEKEDEPDEEEPPSTR